jgi:phosphoinositide-3-kinase, regulatory subunit 4
VNYDKEIEVLRSKFVSIIRDRMILLDTSL